MVAISLLTKDVDALLTFFCSIFRGIHFSNVSRVLVAYVNIIQALWVYARDCLKSVSYTHLTLPTILLVQISVVAVSLKKKKKTIGKNKRQQTISGSDRITETQNKVRQ
eukprot:TRINITY_DN3936_c0_g1_i15.p5 TRINITY_DN3936_c0_g1~~TRINITY_DN3936_c0_g1_i15.p5  ORF type:complete len:109 (-),score=9.05 TRINITY_DN3936_c0_g1_i15:32-358(-)